MTLRQAHPSLPCEENVTRTILDNGLVILVRENFSAPVVAIEGGVPCGSLHEAHLLERCAGHEAHRLDGCTEHEASHSGPSSEQESPFLAGLAGFTASMLTRGSQKYPQEAFDAAVEDVGASLGTGADPHLTMFGATSLAEDFSAMLDVLADILQNPTFPEEQVARTRNRRLVFLQERDHDSAQWAALRFAEGVYGRAHPYGRPVAGYVESVARIQREDMAEFHRNLYTPNGAIIVIAGAVETAAAVEQVAAAFGDWRGPVIAHRLPQPAQLRAEHQQRVFPQGKVQCDMIMGTLAPARSHPDHFAVRVANTILGQFGLMGRLGERLREEMGIAYYVSSQYDAGIGEGVWSASIGANPEHVPQAAAAIVAEFERLGTELVNGEELDDSQSYMRGIVPVALETSSGVASTLFNMEWYGLGLDYLVDYPDLIDAVTAEDVRRVAAAYLCDQPLRLVVAGPEIPAPLPTELLQDAAGAA
jgi:zinc protease